MQHRGYFSFCKELSQRSLFALLLIVMMCLGASRLHAQTPQGTIAGTVTDVSGAAVVGATVTAVSLDTGATRSGTTNGAGGFQIDAVLPGDYRVSAAAVSFGTTVAGSVHVTSSVLTPVVLALRPGSASERVEVAASQEMLRTEGGELSGSLSRQEVDTLPVQSFNPYALATTLPGVAPVETVNLTNGASFAVNGMRPRDNNFLIEGADNNDQGVHGQAFAPENMEAVQEVTFLLNSFSAEFGHGGSVSNLIYQSGSNSFHGAVWDRLLNSSLDATDHNDVLNGNPKAKSRENLYGFRVGGPILHDRAFFFVSTQWDHLRQTANLGVLELPTADGFATLQQFSANPLVANLLTAYGGLRGVNNNFAETIALGADPVTGVDRGSVNFAGVQRSLSVGTSSYESVAKVDFNLSDTDRLQVRYIHAPQSAPIDTQNFPSQLPGFDTMESASVDNAGFTETHLFSKSLLNELRGSWSRIGFTFGLPAQTLANPLAKRPEILITGITGYGIPAGSVPQSRFQDTYVLQDAVSWTKGRHNFKLGADVSDIRVRDLIPFNYYGSETYADAATAGYRALANYIDDFGGTSSNSAQISFGNPEATPTIWSQNYYLQDRWKVAPNLSVDLGVRYEYNGTPFNSLGFPAFNSSDPACFPCNVKQQADKNNIAPRLGFNFSPTPGGRTVISGGFGLFYDHPFTFLLDQIAGSAPNVAVKNIVSVPTGRGTPNWSSVLGTITDRSPLPTDTSIVIAQHLLDPQNYQWNLRVQRELPASFVLSASYVGNRGVHQYATTEFNPLLPGEYDEDGNPLRSIPSRGRIIRQDNTNDSMYHAGQLALEHKTQHGLTMRAAYTYSKSLDTGSEVLSVDNWSTYAERQYPNPRGLEWGPSAFDLKHVFSLTYVYRVPVWRAQGAQKLAGAVVNGWTFSGITSVYSGAPINIETGFDWNGDGIANDRPILSNKKAPLDTWAVDGSSFGFNVLPGVLCDGPYAWQTGDACHPVTADQVHWLTAPFGTQGNDVGRNSVYAKPNQQWDMALQRTFPVYERHAVDFRAESFNVFNHALTNQPGYTVQSSLTTGVFPEGLGTNTFLNYGLTNSGGRTLRFLMKYSF